VTLTPGDIIRLEPGAVVVLDQTLLPQTRVERRCASVADLVEAVRVLAIRGAPALGVAGAMGVALAAELAPVEPEAFRRSVTADAAIIAAARPTAVNLAVGVRHALEAAAGVWSDPVQARIVIAAAAQGFHEDEVRRCEAIGAHGAALFGTDAQICTICNAGALATGGYGTALGVVRAVQAAGHLAGVWVPETRPLLQGARLTAWELGEEGIPHRVVPDGAVAAVFARGEVDGVVVGADRIAANGDTANKVGTYALAVIARHHGVPFYVAAPQTTIDPATMTGSQIPIEERSRDELGSTVPVDSPVWNPAFDVTPAALIDAIITDNGILRPPFDLRA
jgi:methylthioribose-1-phosphate isomerase